MITGKEIILGLCFVLSINVGGAPENKPPQLSNEIQQIQKDIEREKVLTLRYNCSLINEIQIL